MTIEKKLSRSQWIRDLIASGIPEEKILEKMRVGEPEKGIKPIEPPFDKLVYRRINNKLKEAK